MENVIAKKASPNLPKDVFARELGRLMAARRFELSAKDLEVWYEIFSNVHPPIFKQAISECLVGEGYITPNEIYERAAGIMRDRLNSAANNGESAPSGLSVQEYKEWLTAQRDQIFSAE